MSSIDIVVNDLNKFISSIISITPPENRSKNNAIFPTSFINVAVNISTRPLDEVFTKISEKKPYHVQEKKEPLIDIIENSDTIRIIATLPGIRKEDVWFYMKKDVLVVEVTKYGKVYKKEIPCNARADQVSIRSSILNNSVLEITFERV
ncbi:MAG: Hsp20/alpha crystallin family protein [Nitrosotalea sp.]